MLGIIIGVGAVITMVGVGAGAQARVAEEIRSLGSNLIIVLAGTVTSGGVRLGTGSKVSITEDDARAIQREVPSVQVAAPSVQGKAQDGQIVMSFWQQNAPTSGDQWRMNGGVVLLTRKQTSSGP